MVYVINGEKQPGESLLEAEIVKWQECIVAEDKQAAFTRTVIKDEAQLASHIDILNQFRAHHEEKVRELQDVLVQIYSLRLAYEEKLAAEDDENAYNYHRDGMHLPVTPPAERCEAYRRRIAELEEALGYTPADTQERVRQSMEKAQAQA